MLIKNLNVQEQLVNGTRLQVIETHPDTIACRSLINGSLHSFVRTTFWSKGVIRKQFPLIPAFCLSVHKAQGQTLEKVGLELQKQPFTHGQLYTALSRVRRKEGVCIYRPQSTPVKNIVFPELLI